MDALTHVWRETTLIDLGFPGIEGHVALHVNTLAFGLTGRAGFEVANDDAPRLFE